MFGAEEDERFRQPALGLRGRATPEAEQAVGEPFDPRVDDSLGLLEHNEAVIGFENLASNVHEYEISISNEKFVAFAMLAARWGVQLGVRQRDAAIDARKCR